MLNKQQAHLGAFEFEGILQSTTFVETVDVKTGVQCDVYTFDNDK